jgi:hypothetical protein
MRNLRSTLRDRFRGWHQRSPLLAYALLLAFIAIVAILALIFLQPTVSPIFQDTECLQCT